MKRVLILPFLNIPSGHQQVADSLISHLEITGEQFLCKKVDIFSYSYGFIEKYVTNLYLKWIRHLPKTYSYLYRRMVIETLFEDKEKFFYENFFFRQMLKILREFSPDFILCTHALPSRLLNRLKRDAGLKIPVFNIYTDFFIHNGWGFSHIDGHFVASGRMKNILLSKGIDPGKIFITGIPIHPQFRKKPLVAEPPRRKPSILISGGSMGSGNMEGIIRLLANQKNSPFHFYVLCGKNQGLFRKLSKLKSDHISPLPYISSRKVMDLIYNQADLIITKPGGVTISECLKKRLPIMIYDKLPGQEEINYEELRLMNLAMEMGKWGKASDLLEQMSDFFSSPSKLSSYLSSVYQYEKMLDSESPTEIIIRGFL